MGVENEAGGGGSGVSGGEAGSGSEVPPPPPPGGGGALYGVQMLRGLYIVNEPGDTVGTVGREVARVFVGRSPQSTAMVELLDEHWVFEDGLFPQVEKGYRALVFTCDQRIDNAVSLLNAYKEKQKGWYYARATCTTPVKLP